MLHHFTTFKDLIMEKCGKVWGITQKIYTNSNMEFHRIDINRGGVCSKHLHQFKYNGFFVEHGKLLVRTWKNNSKLVDSVILTDGDWHTVKPGEYHQFEALDDTIAFELYWATPLEGEDIFRETEGFKK